LLTVSLGKIKNAMSSELSNQPPLTANDQRRYDLDWLRFIAIVILLFFHTGMWFNHWGWHVKNNELSYTFQYWMIWSHNFRMQLLLFISGAGTFMALGKRTSGEFRKERFTRLFIPLIFGMLVVVPPQIYYERIDQYTNYWEFYKTVFQFKPYPEGGSLSWHHLWFILYLFIYSLISLPFLKFLRSAKSEIFKQKCLLLLRSPAGVLFIPAILILNTQFLLRPFFPEETHDLMNDWAYFVYYFSFFLLGIICYSIPTLWETIGKNRKYFLLATFFALIPFYTCYLHFRGIVHLSWSEDPDAIGDLFDRVSIFLAWFTVITIIAYGQHYLKKPRKWLSKISEGLYPFYILHQSVIIAIGYYVCKLDWSIAAKYWSICFLTLSSCIGFYWLCIRPFNAMRFLFGMKLKKKVLQN
jgi:glucans biosynthesis protein C